MRSTTTTRLKMLFLDLGTRYRHVREGRNTQADFFFLGGGGGEGGKRETFLGKECFPAKSVAPFLLCVPNHQRWYAKMEAQSECVTDFCTFGAQICDAQPVLIDKISASELSWKFVKSALLVGYVCVSFPLFIWRQRREFFPSRIAHTFFPPEVFAKKELQPILW